MRSSPISANKIVAEMINKKQPKDGLINLLIEENLKPEIIKRIIVDFVIAAGDTVSIYLRLFYFCVNLKWVLI